MELKGKLGITAGISGKTLPGFASGGGNIAGSPRAEAFDAMIALGYAEKQIQQALSRVEEVLEPEARAEEWIKKALQVI